MAVWAAEIIITSQHAEEVARLKLENHYYTFTHTHRKLKRLLHFDDIQKFIRRC